jgi:ComF family protein
MDLVLPAVCPACESADVAAEGLCEGCQRMLLSQVAGPYCPRCGAGLPLGAAPGDDGCGRCPQPLPRFNRLVRLGSYARPLSALIRGLKYRRRDAVRRRLGALLATASGAACPQGLDVVLAIPMHWRRRLARGYDHAMLLASAVAGPLGLPVGRELVRIRHTPPQVHLPRTARIQNVRGAFAVRSRRGIEGARVLLVDDVTTTGATANEATRALLAAGAASVVLSVVAKSEPPAAYSESRGSA